MWLGGVGVVLVLVLAYARVQVRAYARVQVRAGVQVLVLVRAWERALTWGRMQALAPACVQVQVRVLAQNAAAARGPAPVQFRRTRVGGER
ncbi:hypothetical protein [Corynebacterium auriscanis]|uniref:hypothetical protein n=1 Tax=Corynebacterium auriscanis TaxID=99807 RepID=UPI003CF8D4A3